MHLHLKYKTNLCLSITTPSPSLGFNAEEIIVVVILPMSPFSRPSSGQSKINTVRGKYNGVDSSVLYTLSVGIWFWFKNSGQVKKVKKLYMNVNSK